MILIYKSEVRKVAYISDNKKLRFNNTEPICNKGLETVSVEMLYVINALKLVTNNQDLILNGTIKPTNDIANVILI
jgi:hypothetical protein